MRLLASLLPAACLLWLAWNPVGADDKLGHKVPAVVLEDSDGKSLRMALAEGKKAVVVVFLSAECPVAASYFALLNDMAKTYSRRGVSFVGISVDDEVPQRRPGENEPLFPLFRDSRLAAAEVLGASVVPQAFVLDADFVLRYRGRIDDSYSSRVRRNPRPIRSDLREALEDVLASRTVRVPSTPAVGCPLPRRIAPRTLGAVTFYRDVWPILQAHCQQCHRPGEAAPFALVTYRQAVRWAADIKDFTARRRMPPWLPVEGGPFHAERRLPEKDIATLAAWADGGTPEGDPRDALPANPARDGWQLGRPDLVLEVPADMTLGAEGDDLFRVFVLPTGLREDRHVAAVQVLAGNRRVAHHALVYFDLSGQAQKLEKSARSTEEKAKARDRGHGYTAAMGVGFPPRNQQDFGELGAWAPGQRVHRLPEGVGYRLPAGADVLLQMHYRRTGREETDRTRVGIYFSQVPVRRTLEGVVIAARFLYIPAGQARFPVRAAVEVQDDCQLHSIQPHMHRLGREVRVTLRPPRGPARILLGIRQWDYNVQEMYFLESPLPVAAGSRVEVDATFDNSAENPSNPFRPPRPVVFGERTEDEMCVVFLGVTAQGRGPVRSRPCAPAAVQP
jgi:peroxiredoxin